MSVSVSVCLSVYCLSVCLFVSKIILGLFIVIPSTVVISRFRIELELRTFAEDGIIVFAGNGNLKSYLYLRLDGGKLRFGFSTTGESVSVATRKNVNKGKWHKVGIRFGFCLFVFVCLFVCLTACLHVFLFACLMVSRNL